MFFGWVLAMQGSLALLMYLQIDSRRQSGS